MAPDRAPQTPAPLNGPGDEPGAIDRGHGPGGIEPGGIEPVAIGPGGIEPGAIEPGAMDREREKELAARAAAELVQDGMALGLGTGSTVAYLLRALGERAGELQGVRCAATSPQTARIARELGLDVRELDAVSEPAGGLDLAIDGADRVDEAGWLVKGGGGAHTREKIVASAARRFVVIVSADKLVERVTGPVPLEIMEFGAHTTLTALGQARLRRPGEHGVGVGDARGDDAAVAEAGVDDARRDDARGDDAAEGEAGTGDAGASGTAGEAGPVQRSPDGNLLAWYEGPVEDPRELAARLSATPGVVEHGLFAPEMVSEVIVGDGRVVRRRAGGKASA